MKKGNSKTIFSTKLAVTTAAIPLLLFAVQANGATVETEATTEVSTERAGVAFTGRLGLGYLTGEAREYVYWPDVEGHKASELIWDIDSVYMLGVGGSIHPLPWLNFNADLWFNLGDGDGHMEDYDWMVPGYDWTDRSISPNTDVTTAMMFDINAEMTVFSNGQVSLNGIVGYRRDNFEWQARGGTYLYSYYTFRDTAGSFPSDELGITYEQTFDVPYLGISVTGDFDRIHLAAKVTGSIFVSGEAVDHHHMRDLVTYDNFSDENMWAIDVSFGYDITDAIEIKAAYFYEKYATMKGDSDWYFNAEGVSFNIPDGAGADLETSMLSMTLTYTF